MKAANRFLGLLLLLWALAAGGGIAQAAFRGGEIWSVWLEIAETHRLIVAAAALATVLVTLLWILTALPRGSKGRFLAFDNPGGEVHVSLDAVRDYLLRTRDDFPGVIKLTPVVRNKRGELDISIGCDIRAGNDIPDLAQQVQERVRERIVNGVGLTSIHAIRVIIRHITESSRFSAATRQEPKVAPDLTEEEPLTDESGIEPEPPSDERDRL